VTTFYTYPEPTPTGARQRLHFATNRPLAAVPPAGTSLPSRRIDRLRCACFRDPGYGHPLGFRPKWPRCDSFNLPAASAVGIFLLDAAAQSPPRRHSACRRRHTRRPLHQHEPRRLQVLYKPLSSDPLHHVVGVIHPLSTLVAERERQSLGDLICGGRAKGRGVGHTPNGSRPLRTCREHQGQKKGRGWCPRPLSCGLSRINLWPKLAGHSEAPGSQPVRPERRQRRHPNSRRQRRQGSWSSSEFSIYRRRVNGPTPAICL
jgi:hypothetical protein